MQTDQRHDGCRRDRVREVAPQQAVPQDEVQQVYEQRDRLEADRVAPEEPILDCHQSARHDANVPSLQRLEPLVPDGLATLALHQVDGVGEQDLAHFRRREIVENVVVVAGERAADEPTEREGDDENDPEKPGIEGTFQRGRAGPP